MVQGSFNLQVGMYLKPVPVWITGARHSVQIMYISRAGIGIYRSMYIATNHNILYITAGRECLQNCRLASH